MEIQLHLNLKIDTRHMKHSVYGTIFRAYHLFYGFSRLLSQKLGKGCFFFGLSIFTFPTWGRN